MSDWMAPVERVLEAVAWRGGAIVWLPEYRPELPEAIAEHFGLAFRDFRRERMAPLGWQATRLGLADLDAFLAEAGRCGPALVHNVEALLATRRREERVGWFTQFLARRREHAVLIPVVLFGDEVAADGRRVVRLDPAAIPPAGFLLRLASMR